VITLTVYVCLDILLYRLPSLSNIFRVVVLHIAHDGDSDLNFYTIRFYTIISDATLRIVEFCADLGQIACVVPEGVCGIQCNGIQECLVPMEDENCSKY